MFRVGDEVICVDDSQGRISGESFLVKGARYRILKMDEDDVWVILGDKGWDKSRFRKVQKEYRVVRISMKKEEPVLS